ncbi:MAG: protein kinase [Kofleriaceae bacterium]|nr:protein kinase [Kofleriaceae bacterium]
MTVAELSVGTSATRYDILGRLAAGGMAEIYLARARALAGVERHLVIKRILPQYARDPYFVAMFLDEARLAAQLQHPNVAQVFDIGRLGDSYFMALEYVHGCNGRELLTAAALRGEQLPIGDVLTIGAGAAAGLHHAHEKRGGDGRLLGIVHRDVSPANLMLSYEGSVKLVDFGIAKAQHREAGATGVGSVKGKVSYMSPEQCTGNPLDRRSDVFSLGVVLFELLTGTRLFRTSSEFETMTSIVYRDAPPPSKARPGLPAELDALVGKALARDVEARFQTAGELLRALEEAAARTGHPLSTSALGHTLGRLVGTRPEPWSLATPAAAPRISVMSEVVAEPSDSDLATSPNLPRIDPDAAAEVDAVLRSSMELPSLMPAASMAMTASPSMAALAASAAFEPVTKATVPGRGAAVVGGTRRGAAPAPARPVDTTPRVRESASVPAEARRSGHTSSPPAVSGALASASPMRPSDPVLERRPRRWPLLLLVLTVVGAGVAAFLMLR